jgi:hypothetical protein
MLVDDGCSQLLMFYPRILSTLAFPAGGLLIATGTPALDTWRPDRVA